MKCQGCYIIKRVALPLLSLLLVAGHACAQEPPAVFLENHVSLDTAIMISSDNTVYSPKLACCTWNECVYLSDYHSASGDTVDVYRLNTHSYGLDRMRFVFGGMASKAMEENYQGLDYIACNDSLFLAATGRHLYIASWRSPEEFKHVVLHNAYDGGKFDKHGNLVLYRYYYGNDTPTELSVYSIERQAIVKTVYPDGGNMLVSYLGGTRLFDVKDDNIIFARPNEFQIDIYDLSLNKKGCIAFADGKSVMDEALWKRARKLPRHAASERLDMFSPFDYDLMLWAYLRGNDVVAVHRTKQGTGKYALHTLVNVFEYQNDTTWRHVLVDAIDRMRKGKDEIVTKATVPVNWVGGNEVLFTEDRIVSITTGTVGAPVGMTMSQYEVAKREWLRSAGYRLQVNIFSFNF